MSPSTRANSPVHKSTGGICKYPGIGRNEAQFVRSQTSVMRTDSNRRAIRTLIGEASKRRCSDETRSVASLHIVTRAFAVMTLLEALPFGHRNVVRHYHCAGTPDMGSRVSPFFSRAIKYTIYNRRRCAGMLGASCVWPNARGSNLQVDF